MISEDEGLVRRQLRVGMRLIVIGRLLFVGVVRFFSNNHGNSHHV